MTAENTTPSAPEKFHEVVLRVLAQHRKDTTLPDFRLMQILLGEFHGFVQRLDIRLKAEGAVDKLVPSAVEVKGKPTVEELEKLLASAPSPVTILPDGEVRAAWATPKQIVDAVIKAVMEDN